MGLFRKCKTGITSKVHGTDLATCSHSREGESSSHNQIKRYVFLVAELHDCKSYIRAMHTSVQIHKNTLDIIDAILLLQNASDEWMDG